MQTNHTNKTLWYFTLPVLVLMACAFQPQARAQMTSIGVPCSDIAKYHMLKQDNMGAGLVLIECGVVKGGSGGALSSDQIEEPQPPNVLVSNRSCSSGSSCTRSESAVFRSTRSGDNTIVVNYNDHNGNNYSGTSFSADGGQTFTQIIPAPFANGHGENFGDPIVVFNQKLNKWFAGDLASGCGGFGIGTWSSTDGQTWATSACGHSGSNDDRESMWVDNNPFSLKYGRMYISFNNFNIGGGALQITHSDDGNTWSTPVSITDGSTFIRDVQVTGTLPGPPPPNVGFTSTVFVAGMNEMGGGNANRQNLMFRSTDGGATFSSITMGAPFPAVGDSTCPENGYFYQVNPIWRHMGWGEPAVGPGGIVHYVFAGKGQATNDHGDIYYTRSADNGLTWSTPIKLNDDPGGQFKTQWMPSLSVDYNPAAFTQPQDVTASWYDRRSATSACNNVTDPGCNYERYGVQSHDNGVTWAANFAISSGIIPQPAQEDSGVVGCYAGDYDYSTAFGNRAFVTWTDGRVSVGGVQVQSVEFAAVPE